MLYPTRNVYYFMCEPLSLSIQSIWSVADEGKDFSPRYPLIFPKSEPSHPLGHPLFIFSKSKLMLKLQIQENHLMTPNKISKYRTWF